MSPSLSESKALTLSKTPLALREGSREEGLFLMPIMPFKLKDRELSSMQMGGGRHPRWGNSVSKDMKSVFKSHASWICSGNGLCVVVIEDNSGKMS